MKHRGKYVRALTRKTLTFVGENYGDPVAADTGKHLLSTAIVLRSNGKAGDAGLRSIWNHVEVLSRLSRLPREQGG